MSGHRPGRRLALPDVLYLCEGAVAGDEARQHWRDELGRFTDRLAGLMCERLRIAPNILDGNFMADAPNRKWAGDISYIWTSEGWLYLAIVLDLFSRRIIGWAVSDRLKKDLALRALQRAITMRCPPPGLIHHSDRGSQYCSGDYQKLLGSLGIIASMSGKGNCYDNAMVETVFKTIKSDLVWRTRFLTRADAELAIGRYIDGFYNPRRRHSALGYKSPVTFEAIMASAE
jgi:putative transposase